MGVRKALFDGGADRHACSMQTRRHQHPSRKAHAPYSGWGYRTRKAVMAGVTFALIDPSVTKKIGDAAHTVGDLGAHIFFV